LVRLWIRIVEYWPEFGQKGKEQTTVADLMRHEAGLATAGPVSLEDCLPKNLRLNKVGKMLEESEQEWPEEGRRQYHGNSRGWIANEIFRRVHPEGSTIGRSKKNYIFCLLKSGQHQASSFGPKCRSL